MITVKRKVNVRISPVRTPKSEQSARQTSRQGSKSVAFDGDCDSVRPDAPQR